MKKLILLFIISATLIKGQTLQWSNSVGGSSNSDICNEVKTDASGNVYHVGGFYGTVDFDPGPGVANLPGASIISGYVSKYNAAGAYQWAVTFLGTGISNVKDVATDAAGNVFVTGVFDGTADFDPGPGTVFLSGSGDDVFILKLSPTGTFMWVKQIGSVNNDGGKSIATDAAGNVYIAGECSGPSSYTIDLNPGGLVNSFPFYATDFFVVKLDNAGNYVTAQSYGSSGTDLINKVRTDAAGNVYMCGYFFGAVPTLTLTTTGNNSGYVAKLTNSLVATWAIPYNGDAYTAVNDIEIDGSGNVYACGLFRGSTDFNGSAATFSLTSPSSTDYDGFVTKVSSAGAFVWADEIAAGTGTASANGLSLDPANNVFVIGYFGGTADFNPAIATFNKYSAGSNDIFVCKLDLNGVFSNDAQTFGSTGSDIGTGIQCWGTGNYIISGYYSASVDFNPGTGVTTETSNGGTDIIVAKYASCVVPPLTTASSPTLITACINSSTVLAVTPSGGVTYSWYSVPGGGTSLGSGNSFTTPVISTVTTFWVEGVNACGATARIQFSINVTASPTVNISASSPSVCSGLTTTLTASGASTYTWSTGATTTVAAVAPTITTVYTATGTAATGCRDTQTISISVVANPTVNISASSSSVCSGSSATLTATGASTYSWSSGGSGTSTSVSPTITTVYTATGTAATGCKDTQTISISSVANPTVNISASSPSICSGSSTSLTASGASTYSWSTGATTTVTAVSPSITTVYTATGTAVSGCKDTQTISVNVTTTPTLTTTHYTICAGGTATLSASGATTYSWSTSATTSSITVSPASNTTYTVTGNNGSCTDVNTVSVTVGSSISIAVTPTAPAVCIGNTITLSATGATSYTWSTGSNSTSIAVSPTVNTTYTISGTSGSCSGTRTIAVVANANPTVAATSSSTVICLGNTATLSATGATSYSWNPGSLAGSSVTVSPAGSTIYTVVGSNAAGCTNTRTVALTVSACTGINELSSGKTINIYPNPNNGEFNLVVPELGMYTIVNSIGQTVEVIEVKENEQTISVQGLADGIYFVIGKSAKAKIIVSK